MTPPTRGSDARAPHRVLDRCAVAIAAGDSLDLALRKFRRLVDKAGIIGALKRHEHYVKPGERRRLKSRRARRRERKAAERHEGA
jgi:small subunit ribosomal protein S21